MAKAKQRTLSFNVGGEVIVSRPFDFEALCLMNDVHAYQTKGKFSICANAIPYLFEGTKVTNDVIENADVTELGVLCDELWDIYTTEIDNMAKAKLKNTKSPTRD